MACYFWLLFYLGGGGVAVFLYQCIVQTLMHEELETLSIFFLKKQTGVTVRLVAKITKDHVIPTSALQIHSN